MTSVVFRPILFSMKAPSQVKPSMTAWEDTPELIRQQGYMSQKDLCKNLGLSRSGLYYVLQQSEGKGYKVRRSILGKKLYLHLGDVMAALFPDEKRRSK